MVDVVGNVQVDLHIGDRVTLVYGFTSGLGLAIAATLAREACRLALAGHYVK